MEILLGFGGSANSRRALEQTVERVRETGDSLTVAIFNPEDVEGTLTELESEVREALESAGVEADIRRISGHPGGELVEMADEEFDRLVIGGGSRSPLGKIRLGAIVEFVIVNSSTPVTLIK